MTPADSRRAWRGIVPPMLTPLLDRDTLDEEGLERLVEHILAGGVHGLFVLGTTGEAPSLSYALRKRVLQRVCKQVGGRVPVVVGISDTSFVESIHMAGLAADAGAEAVVLAPPYYFPAGQPELLEYTQHMVPELPLPVFLYNLPAYTKLRFDPETIQRVAEHPNVAGLKDSSADMMYFHIVHRLMKDRDDFALFVGPEELLADALLLGGDGGITGGANMHPRLYVDLYEAACRRDLETVARLHEQVMQIRLTIYSVGKHTSSFLKGVKCALSCMGICSDFMAEPFHRFRKEERQRIHAHLEELGLL